jgi:hypothetical protein
VRRSSCRAVQVSHGRLKGAPGGHVRTLPVRPLNITNPNFLIMYRDFTRFARRALLADEITPRMNGLRAEKAALLRSQRAGAEIEKLVCVLRAHEWMGARLHKLARTADAARAGPRPPAPRSSLLKRPRPRL